jgi:hypothetical protein
MSSWPAPARDAASHGVAGEFVTRTAPHTRVRPDGAPVPGQLRRRGPQRSTPRRSWRTRRATLTARTRDRAATATREWVASLARPRSPCHNAPRTATTPPGERSTAKAKRSQRATHTPPRPRPTPLRCLAGPSPPLRATSPPGNTSLSTYPLTASLSTLHTTPSLTCPRQPPPATAGRLHPGVNLRFVIGTFR